MNRIERKEKKQEIEKEIQDSKQFGRREVKKEQVARPQPSYGWEGEKLSTELKNETINKETKRP